jgi:hypothetical protein
MPIAAIDIPTIKATVSLRETIEFLGLTLKKNNDPRFVAQWRGQCPACKPNDPRDRSLVVIEGRGAYCLAMQHTAQRFGGDQCWLVSHIRNITYTEAAKQLHVLVDDEVVYTPKR